MIAVFTKYDQFKCEIEIKVQDEDCNQETDIDAETENIFDQHYLTSLGGHSPYVCLESMDVIIR